MLAKVRQAIAEHALLSEGDAVLVALSGGPDSVALLHILHRLRRRLKLELAAVYLNHEIRPRAARREEAFCQQLCDRLGVELTIVREDIPRLAKERKQGLEETARAVRYALLESLAQEDGFDKVALAHHADDHVETILFRILRGTGRTGLLGIPVARGIFVRPLLGVTKEDVCAYLKHYNLEYCVDRSNVKTAQSRNFIRRRLLPEIRRRLNPKVDLALLKLSDVVSEEEAFLEQSTEAVWVKIARRTAGGKIELDLRGFGVYDKWLRRRLLRRCLTGPSGNPPAPGKTVIDRLERLCDAQHGSVSLPGGFQVVRAGDKLIIGRAAIGRYSQPLEPGKVTELSPLSVNVRCTLLAVSAQRLNTQRRSRRVKLDWEKLSLPLVARNIRRGDRFVPLGMKGSRKVGDYLTDRKVPPVYRDEIPVVCDKDGIVWLVGFEISDRVKIDALTKKVLSLEITE